MEGSDYCFHTDQQQLVDGEIKPSWAQTTNPCSAHESLPFWTNDQRERIVRLTKCARYSVHQVAEGGEHLPSCGKRTENNARGWGGKLSGKEIPKVYTKKSFGGVDYAYSCPILPSRCGGLTLADERIGPCRVYI